MLLRQQEYSHPINALACAKPVMMSAVEVLKMRFAFIICHKITVLQHLFNNISNMRTLITNNNLLHPA